MRKKSRDVAVAKIPAQFLTAPPPPAVTVIPAGFVITVCKPRQAYGAKKSRMANRGDAPTSSHAAHYTGHVTGNSQHTHTRNCAGKW